MFFLSFKNRGYYLYAACFVRKLKLISVMKTKISFGSVSDLIGHVYVVTNVCVPLFLKFTNLQLLYNSGVETSCFDANKHIPSVIISIVFVIIQLYDLSNEIFNKNI